MEVYVDGAPTSISCIIPAGQLSCSATGSVSVAELSKVAMKNEGPGVFTDPTAIILMELY